jgi:hypothetical protein
MKLAITMLLLAAVAALPLAAASVDTAKFAQATGVRLDGGAKVNMAEGQTFKAKVVNPAVLAKLGLKGAKPGEVVQVTCLGESSWKFLHVPSGQQITKKVGTDFPDNFLW